MPKQATIKLRDIADAPKNRPVLMLDEALGVCMPMVWFQRDASGFWIPWMYDGFEPTHFIDVPAPDSDLWVQVEE